MLVFCHLIAPPGILFFLPVNLSALPPLPIEANQTVYDDDGARLLTLAAVLNESLILGRWYGYASPTSVQHGASAVLTFIEQHPTCCVALSDGTRISGDWMELLPWACYDFLPRFVGAGIRALAFLAPEDPATRLGVTAFALAARVVFPAKVFEEEEEARRWLATYAAESSR